METPSIHYGLPPEAPSNSNVRTSLPSQLYLKLDPATYQIKIKINPWEKPFADLDKQSFVSRLSECSSTRGQQLLATLSSP